MDSILIFVPTEREAEFFCLNADGESAGAFSGVGTCEVRIEICGVGMAECAAATASLLADRKPDLVILAGIAGTYTDEPAVGDTVVVASETVADLGRRNPDGGFTPLFQKTYPATFIPEGFPTAHSNTVSMAGGIGESGEAESEGKSEYRAELCTAGMELGPNGSDSPLVQPYRREKAIIENMEGAAFFAVCERFGIPAMEVRTISNRVGEPVTSEGLDSAARRLAADLAKIIRRLSERE